MEGGWGATIDAGEYCEYPNMGSAPGAAGTAGKEHRKQAVRRWKLENPQEGQDQSPGRGLFLLGGKGVKISAALSRTRLLLGETSIAFSLRALPFMHKLSAA
jgi:hypothetical protein